MVAHKRSKKSPLKNNAILFNLNPYAKAQKRAELKKQEKAKKAAAAKKQINDNTENIYTKKWRGRDVKRITREEDCF